jgi:hypothetical protein
MLLDLSALSRRHAGDEAGGPANSGPGYLCQGCRLDGTAASFENALAVVSDDCDHKWLNSWPELLMQSTAHSAQHARFHLSTEYLPSA